jgi:putative endonuclease
VNLPVHAAFVKCVSAQGGCRPIARTQRNAAAKAIDPRQQQRIIAAANAWLGAHPEDTQRDMRFDAVFVFPGRLPRHLAAAFDASAR